MKEEFDIGREYMNKNKKEKENSSIIHNICNKSLQ